MSETHADAAQLLGAAVAEVTTRAVEPALQPFRDDLSALRGEIAALVRRMEEKTIELDDAAKESSDALLAIEQTLARFRAEAEVRVDEVTRLRDEVGALRFQLHSLPGLLDRIRAVQEWQEAVSGELVRGRGHLIDNQGQVGRQLARLRRLVLLCVVLVVAVPVGVGILVALAAGG